MLKKLKLDRTSRLELDDETITSPTNVSLRFVLMSLRDGYVPTSRKAPQTTNLLKSTNMWVRKYLICPYLLWISGFPKISQKQAVNNKQQKELTNQKLVGGLKTSSILPLLGEGIHFDKYFQLGWFTQTKQISPKKAPNRVVSGVKKHPKVL